MAKPRPKKMSAGQVARVQDESRRRWNRLMEREAAAVRAALAAATEEAPTVSSEYGTPPKKVREAARKLPPEAVAELWHMLNTEERAGWSSNDFGQAVDDWFTQHGFPTIIYA